MNTASLQKKLIGREECREGYNLAIDFQGKRLWSLAVAASLDKARPFGRLAREWVISHLNAQYEAKGTGYCDPGQRGSVPRLRRDRIRLVLGRLTEICAGLISLSGFKR